MEQKQNNESQDEMISLGEMRKHLKEWSVDGLREEVSDIDFEDYDKAISIYDKVTGEHMFYGIFEYGIPISDDAKVYMIGIRNEELRGLIKQCIELDKQIESYKDQNQAKVPTQKGE